MNEHLEHQHESEGEQPALHSSADDEESQHLINSSSTNEYSHERLNNEGWKYSSRSSLIGEEPPCHGDTDSTLDDSAYKNQVLIPAKSDGLLPPLNLRYLRRTTKALL